MSLILALITATIIVLFRLVRKEKPAEIVKPVLVKRYVHPGHSWLKINQDGDVLVGLDDFGQSLIGSIDEVKLPKLLHRVSQGKAGWTVRHGHRTVEMRSPVTGWVVEKNEMVLNNPSLINSAPFGDGWLFKVRPSKINFQLQNLLTGRDASRWQDTERAELGRFFSGTPALMFQEGGVLLQNLADKCSDDEWKGLAAKFFRSEAE
jgi:glycine cleavage system H protein